MAGHSKWSKIKRAKAANDAKRSKIFTRYLREIQVAAKLGGGDPDGNVRLKRCIDAAKSQGVPGDNIEKAIKRGTGDLEGVDYEEVTYEAYGPGGVGLIIKTLTDSKNRTVGEIRHVLSKNGGKLASSNAVAYQFDEQAVFTAPKAIGEEDTLMETVLDAGASDLVDLDDVWEIYTDLSNYDTLLSVLQSLVEGQNEIEVTGEIRMIPQNTVMLEGENEDKIIALMDGLDDLDDVQDVFSNFDLPES